MSLLAGGGTARVFIENIKIAVDIKIEDTLYHIH
jgi:hypothetical protein